MFKYVQMCSNEFKTFSNVIQCNLGFLGGLWVAKLGFGRLKVVIGDYEWLSGVWVLH